ncbi:MAG: hypothetical protein K6E19_11235 [Lachnospiraceae bacterium]|nr:hypothetical protein [Lachnospiraceae bacterium]
MKFNPKEFFSKNHILHNFGLKVLSLVIAVILWLIVINLTDPVMPQTYRNVPVKLLNTDVVTSEGKTIRIVDGTDVVPSIVIKAPRSIISQMGAEYIVATADFTKLSADNTMVQIDFSTTKYSEKVESIKSGSDKLLVEIENRKTIQLPIQYTTSGEITDGYILGKVSLGQNQVRVSGPESVVSSISKASVDVQLTGFTEDISTLSDIGFYNKEGELIPTDELTLNVDSVRINAEILATKRVPIYYATVGSPADGYSLTGEILCDPETVIIAGSAADIEDVSLINIPASELNITGQKSNLVTTLDLETYLPNGIRLGDSKFNGKVSFTVYIEPLITDSFGVYMRNVNVLNVPEEFDYEFDSTEDNLEINLTGLAQDLEKMALSTLNFRIDFDKYAAENGVKEFHEGTYNLDLILDLPTGVTLKDPVRIRVNLTQKQKEGEDENN